MVHEHRTPSGRIDAKASVSAPIAGRTSRMARVKSSIVTLSFSFSFSIETVPDIPDASPVTASSSASCRYLASACDCAAPTSPLISAPE